MFVKLDKNNRVSRLAVFALGLCILPLAQANLIQNGSFENVDTADQLNQYGSTNTWQIYSSLPDWEASRNIEVWQSGFQRVNAPEGQQFIELNAHPRGGSAFSIYQDIATEVGVQYELSFFARKRSRGSEAFNISIDNLMASVDSHVRGRWTQFQFSFIGNGGLSRFTLSSADGGRDTTGNFIDDIRISAVPEPGTIALLAAGFVGLTLTRRTEAKKAS